MNTTDTKDELLEILTQASEDFQDETGALMAWQITCAPFGTRGSARRAHLKRLADAVRKHIAAERAACADVVARAAQRWPDNPLVRSVLTSLAEELREGLRG